MRKICAIFQMFHGIRGNAESISLSKHYKKKLKKTAECEKQFRETLKSYPNLYKMYEEVNDCILTLNSQDNFDYYAEGFRFGVQLGMDIIKPTNQKE